MMCGGWWVSLAGQCPDARMPRTCQAPWPAGFTAKWWIKEVFRVRTFDNKTDYHDLVDIRRFFWSSRLAVFCLQRYAIRCVCTCGPGSRQSQWMGSGRQLSLLMLMHGLRVSRCFNSSKPGASLMPGSSVSCHAYVRTIVPPGICRTDSDTEAVWMSGDRRALFFWVLQRHSVHGEPELRKVAGFWKACIMHCNRR